MTSGRRLFHLGERAVGRARECDGDTELVRGGFDFRREHQVVENS
jgi:hypothetical protein